MPTPQKNLLFVEQASCLFLKGGLDAHPTKELTLCGTGILPVLENAAKFQSQLIL
jgi:hypothetical protein